MILIIVAILLLLIDLYVYQGFLEVLNYFEIGQSTARLLKFGYWLFTGSVLGYFLFYRLKFAGQNPSFTIRILLSLGVGAFISKFVSSLLLLLDDFRRIILILANQLGGFDLVTSKSGLYACFAIGFGIGLYLLLLYGIFRNRHRYRLKEVTIPIEGLATNLEGFRIVQISDIHSGSFKHAEDIKPGVEMINAQKADIVFFTGDLVNNVATEIEPYIDTFKKIQSRLGVYSILGNHDYGDYVRWPSQDLKRQNQIQLFDAHKRLGWQLLTNEHRVVDVNGSKLGIIGIENYSAKGRFAKYGDMQKSIFGMPSTDLKILLSHDPSHWDAEITSQFNDIALTLSGHTHGMQFGFEISDWVKWSPIQYVYKKWAGLYSQGSQFLYINRGFGYLGYPGRVGILPEITLITLTKAN